MKRLCYLIKQLLVAPFIIYLYNLIAQPLNLIVPINIFTICFVGLLGIPGLVTLVVFLFIAF